MRRNKVGQSGKYFLVFKVYSAMEQMCFTSFGLASCRDPIVHDRVFRPLSQAAPRSLSVATPRHLVRCSSVVMDSLESASASSAISGRQPFHIHNINLTTQIGFNYVNYSDAVYREDTMCFPLSANGKVKN